MKDRARYKGRFTRVLIPVARAVRVEHSVHPEAEASGRMGQHAEHRFTDLYAPANPMKKLKALLTREPDIAGKRHLRPAKARAMDEHLLYRAPYDQDAMLAIAKRGGLKKLINLMYPYLSAERKRMLLERAGSIIHAKQRAAELEARPALIAGDKEHIARRLSKSERRAMREGKGKRVKA